VHITKKKHLECEPRKYALKELKLEKEYYATNTLKTMGTLGMGAHTWHYWGLNLGCHSY
jgi:hypothetical protein